MGNQQTKEQQPEETVHKSMAPGLASTPPLKVRGARGLEDTFYPGSPLTYGPQPPMEPLSGATAFQGPVSAEPPPQEFHGVPGWPSQGTLVPSVIVWSHGGNSVEVEGSWDNWTSRMSLLKSGKDFTIVKLLMPGMYQYKFIVDGQWKYAPDHAAIFDEMGNVNNIVEVQEHAAENIDNLSLFVPPPSPPSSYTNERMLPEEFKKDPPNMPKHLNLTLLNVPQFVEAPAALPRPQHVILNHAYEESHKSTEHAHVLGMTYRYRSKYVTTVLYKSKDSGTEDFPP